MYRNFQLFAKISTTSINNNSITYIYIIVNINSLKKNKSINGCRNGHL